MDDISRAENVPGGVKNAPEMSEESFPMREADMQQVLEIENRCFPVPWSRRSFLAELSSPHALSIVTAVCGPLVKNGIRAYSCNRIIGDELNILRMAVAPESRRLGLASRLLDRVLHLSRRKGATEAYLEVRPSNVPAISLYTKKGFRVIGTRPGYYPETGEDALVMMTNIKEIS